VLVIKSDILKGKSALITGASGGIGAAIAKQLFESGCNVFLTGRNEKKIDDLRKELSLKKKWHFHTAASMAADLTKEDDLRELIKRIRHTYKLDILVNSAGLFPIKPLLETDLDDYEKCMAVNVKAPFILSREFAPDFIKSGWGRIINIGSSSAYGGSGDTGLYCISKHALLGLGRSLFHELKEHGTRVYSVSPGSTQTAMGATDTRQDFKTFIRPEEVAEYVEFIIKFNSEMISEEIRLNRILIR